LKANFERAKEEEEVGRHENYLIIMGIDIVYARTFKAFSSGDSL
jgi:hypothetical protein